MVAFAVAVIGGLLGARGAGPRTPGQLTTTYFRERRRASASPMVTRPTSRKAESLARGDAIAQPPEEAAGALPVVPPVALDPGAVGGVEVPAPPVPPVELDDVEPPVPSWLEAVV